MLKLPDWASGEISGRMQKELNRGRRRNGSGIQVLVQHSYVRAIHMQVYQSGGV